MCYNFIARTYVRAIASQLLFLSSHVHGALGASHMPASKFDRSTNNTHHALSNAKRETRPGEPHPKRHHHETTRPPHLRRAGRPAGTMHASIERRSRIDHSSRTLSHTTNDGTRAPHPARARGADDHTYVHGRTLLHAWHNNLWSEK